jgi:hypothetical protein
MKVNEGGGVAWRGKYRCDGNVLWRSLCDDCVWRN